MLYLFMFSTCFSIPDIMGYTAENIQHAQANAFKIRKERERKFLEKQT